MCNNDNIHQLRQCNRLLLQLLLTCLEFSGCGGNLFELAADESTSMPQSGCRGRGC